VEMKCLSKIILILKELF